MTKLMTQAMAYVATLPNDTQDELARHLMDEAKRIAILKAIAEADANPDASVPHEDVCKWVESWGTEHELPAPQCK